MDKQFEYYKVTRNDSALLSPDKGNPPYLYEEVLIESPELMRYKLQEPVERKPRLVDYHSDSDSIISKKIYEVLSSMNIDGIQLLPAQIRGKNDEIYLNYWAVHIYNHIQCIDLDLSDCKISIGIRAVEKLFLNKAILESIPLSKRLVFRLKEDISYQLFHLSVVEKIMNVKPEGIRFVNIEDWNRRSHSTI